MRHAVIGTGVVGTWHLKLIPHLPGSQLAAVCEKSPGKGAKALASAGVNDPNVQIFLSVEEMFDKIKPDVVHVATPSGEHEGPVISALERGVNVICEKPLEIKLDRIDRMIETSKRTGSRLAAIFQNRWVEANRAIKDAVDEGRFGRLAWAASITPWYRTDQYYRDGGWRGTWQWDGGGAVMNQSVHAIDLLQWIAGPVKRVSAYASSRIHPEIEVEDTCSCALQFENGAFGTIMGSTAIYPGGPVRIEVGGENGHAISELALKQFKFRDERPSDKELLEKLAVFGKSTGGGASNLDVQLDRHVKNITHILDSWKAGKDAETCGSEARKAVAIITAMYESVRNNGAAVDVK